MNAAVLNLGSPESGGARKRREVMVEEPDSPEEPVTVSVCYGRGEAHVVRAKLAEAGIDSYLRAEAIGGLYGLSVDGLGRVEVVVAAADAERAREILDTDAAECD